MAPSNDDEVEIELHTFNNQNENNEGDLERQEEEEEEIEADFTLQRTNRNFFCHLWLVVTYSILDLSVLFIFWLSSYGFDCLLLGKKEINRFNFRDHSFDIVIFAFVRAAIAVNFALFAYLSLCYPSRLWLKSFASGVFAISWKFAFMTGFLSLIKALAFDYSPFLPIAVPVLLYPLFTIISTRWLFHLNYLWGGVLKLCESSGAVGRGRGKNRAAGFVRLNSTPAASVRDARAIAAGTTNQSSEKGTTSSEKGKGKGKGDGKEEEEEEEEMTVWELLAVLKPYFWPKLPKIRHNNHQHHGHYHHHDRGSTSAEDGEAEEDAVVYANMNDEGAFADSGENDENGENENADGDGKGKGATDAKTAEANAGANRGESVVASSPLHPPSGSTPSGSTAAPSATADLGLVHTVQVKRREALMNRLRAVSTWVFVVLSKVCSVTAPVYIGKASQVLSDAVAEAEALTQAQQEQQQGGDDIDGNDGNDGAGDGGGNGGGGTSAYYSLALAQSYPLACRYILLYVGLIFLGRVLKEIQGVIYLRVKQSAYIEIAERAFAHLHSLSLQWHLSKKMGNVIRSMDRGTEAANSMVQYLFLYLLPAVGECFAVCVIFVTVIDRWELSATAFVALAVYAYVTVGLTQWRKKFRAATNRHDNAYHDKCTDSLMNYETVKYFTAERFEVFSFGESVRKYQQNSVNTQASLSLLNSTQQLIIYTTTGICLSLAARAILSGEMEIGQFITVNIYVLNLFSPLSFLGTIYAAVIRSMVDMKNLSILLKQSPDVVDRNDAVDIPMATPTTLQQQQQQQRQQGKHGKLGKAKAKLRLQRSQQDGGSDSGSELDGVGGGGVGNGGISIEFRNVCFHYPTQRPSKGLKNVNFVVPKGTTTAVVGHTGAGKTTLSRLLFRFYDPLHGAVLLNGHDIKNYRQRSVRSLIGIVPQDTVLFNHTLLYNIKYGKMDASPYEVITAARRAQLYPFIESLPQGWLTVVGERGLKLSGGEKQRVAIARCLLKNPPIVVLDEATSALDTKTEREVQLALSNLKRNRTTLVIAHRLSTVMSADQIVVMDNGLVVEKGTHQELINKSTSSSDNSSSTGGATNYYAELWSMQLGVGDGVGEGEGGGGGGEEKFCIEDDDDDDEDGNGDGKGSGGEGKQDDGIITSNGNDKEKDKGSKGRVIRFTTSFV